MTVGFAPTLASGAPAGTRVVRTEYPAGVAGVKMSLENIAQRIREGALSPAVQGVAFDALRKAGFAGRGAGAGDTFQRAAALLTFVRENTLYAPDPPGFEYVKSAEAMLCLRPGLCVRGGDCFPETTGLKVRGGVEGPDDCVIRPIKNIHAGDDIWGLDRWTRVKDVWATGKKSVDSILLDNGERFEVSPEHHLWVWGPGVPQGPGTLERVRLGDVYDTLSTLTLPRPQGPAARVVTVTRGVREVECFDLTTEDGFVYLPVADVTVSNCDDQVVLLGSLCMGAGIPVNVIKQTFGSGDQEHVLIEAQGDSGNWIPLDPSSEFPAGKKAPASSEFRLDPSSPSTIGLTGVPDAEFIGVGSLGNHARRFIGDASTATTPAATWTPLEYALAITAAGIVVGAGIGLAQRYRQKRGRR